MPGTYETGTQEQLISNLAGDAQAKPAGMFGSNMSPEMFAIILDSIGKGMDPKNPMAGIGTNLAQSSMASQERNKQNAKQDDMIKMFLNYAYGNKNITPAGERGITGIKKGLDKDGNEVLNIELNPNDPGQVVGSRNASPRNTGTQEDISPFY